MEREYTPDVLRLLHRELYDILSKVVKVCEKYKIEYFVIGGTLIGAKYDHSILPWDDDVDIGMTRENYNRFLQVAQNELGDGYFVSSFDSEPHTPFFYAKVHKNNTLFVEEKYKGIDMHQGVFVDIFPFDNVPNKNYLRKFQFKVVNFLKTCLMGKEVWMWKYFKKCEIKDPLQRSLLSTFLCWCIVSLFSKKTIYDTLLYFMVFYNNRQTTHIGLVVTQVDYFETLSVRNLQNLSFGPLTVRATSNIEEYMKYNSLHRFTQDELKNHPNHQPLILKLSD